MTCISTSIVHSQQLHLITIQRKVNSHVTFNYFRSLLHEGMNMTHKLKQKTKKQNWNMSMT